MGCGAAAYAFLRPRALAVQQPASASVTKSLDTSAFDTAATKAISEIEKSAEGADGIKIATFLGNESRRFYGIGPVPEKLEVIWKNRIGSGKTSGTATSKGATVWSGTGWTGQPTLVRDRGRNYLLVGGFDHGLRKIDAETGKTVWRYEFDDVIKGTNTVFVNPHPSGAADRMVVVCGSRKGWDKHLGNSTIAPLRAVSFATGKELWRLPSPHTRAYSEDADASGLLIGKWFYAALECGYLFRLDPSNTVSWGHFSAPVVKKRTLLYEPADVAVHGGNLLPEGSPALLGNRLYIESGAGHIYGLSLPGLRKVWDFRTGSDMESTVVTTKKGLLLCGIEKQYIKGKGGLIALNPKKSPSKAVAWYFPTGDRHFVDWDGGVIGSASVNDEYDTDGSTPALAAVNGIDRFTYLISQDKTTGKKVLGFDGVHTYPTPVTVFRDNIGGSISTPIIVGNHLIAAGYGATVHVYRITYGKPGTGVTLPSRDGSRKVGVRVKEVATFHAGAFESTPIVWRGRIYIGSRDGNLYCLGVK